MNINRKHIAALLAASAMAFGIAANAQPQSPQSQPGYGCAYGYGMGPGMMGPGGGRGYGYMMGDPSAFAEQHLSQFKSQLKITPQQEPLWQAFADQMKTNAGQMGAMHQSMRQQMTAPERMDAMLGFMKSRISAMETVHDSFKRLYDALTPEQKTVADKFQPFVGSKGQKRGPGGRGMGGPGGGMGPGAQGQGPAGGPAPR